MKAEILIDWLTFTIHGVGGIYKPRWEAVAEFILKMDPKLFENRNKGMNGYDCSVEHSGIYIMYGGREDMGVCVSMSGNACRVFEEYENGMGMQDLVKKIYELMQKGEREGAKLANVSRIDIAADDKGGWLDMDVIERHLRSGLVNTRLKDVCERNSYKLGRKRKGHDAKSVYIGSEKSEFRYRIYDKAKQQGDYEGHWIRLEMVNRGDYAAGAAAELALCGDEIGAAVAAMINGNIRFVNDDNARLTRCSIAEWWRDFIETVEKVRHMCRIKAVQTAEKLYFRFENQLKRTVAIVRELWGMDFIAETADLGMKSLESHHEAMISEYRAAWERMQRKLYVRQLMHDWMAYGRCEAA